jgi:8-oxo-dGTP diphosphatase
MIQCVFENGAKTSLRHVTVGALVINNKKQILVGKRAKHLSNGGKYGLPSGFMDRDETTAETAIRELKEETGLDGEIVSLFQIIDMPNRPKEDRQNVHFNYIVEMTGGNFVENSEVEETRWIGKDELPSEDEFAFDHRRFIEKYFEYLEKPFDLPLIGY